MSRVLLFAVLWAALLPDHALASNRTERQALRGGPLVRRSALPRTPSQERVSRSRFAEILGAGFAFERLGRAVDHVKEMHPADAEARAARLQELLDAIQGTPHQGEKWLVLSHHDEGEGGWLFVGPTGRALRITPDNRFLKAKFKPSLFYRGGVAPGPQWFRDAVRDFLWLTID